MKIREIEAKSILVKSNLPDADWVVNPYLGCQFGCKYCYAAFIGRWKHPGEEWGGFLDIKINAPALLKRELEKLEKKHESKNFGSIFFSSVTDPYLGLEARYGLTRKCLEALVEFGYKGKVGILTKSPLVTRDIDLFKKLKSEVGLTVTTLEDKVVKFMEGYAPPASARIKALKKLTERDISTYAFIGPLLPHFVTRKEKLEKLLRAVKRAGVKSVYIEHINLSPKIKERLYQYLRRVRPELIRYFEEARTEKYRERLEKIIFPILSKNKLKLIDGKIIYHVREKIPKRGGF